jgi:N-acetylglutamate synthase-like GNAT family acetyltransferase
MNAPAYTVRRATLDDLPHLAQLWASMRFPVEDLSRRVTEFQVALGPHGVAGAIGLQVLERQACIHSEAFTDFALADQLRPLLWERLQSIANNTGLLRIWTGETAPFWSHCGLQRADAAALQLLPAPWVKQGCVWHTLKLREDIDAVKALEAEFAMFMQAERNRTERTIQSAKMFKTFATVVAFIVAALAIGGVLYLFQKNPSLFHR